MVTPEFGIAPGAEEIWNVDTKLPSHKNIDISQVEISADTGACRVEILSRPDTIHDEARMSFDDPDWTKWYPIAVCGARHLLWKLPDGVVLRQQHHGQLEIRMHYLDTPASPVRGTTAQVAVAITPARTGDPQYLVGSMVAESTGFALPPHETVTLTKTIWLPHDITLLAIAGEYHRWGTGMTVEVVDPMHGGANTIYSTAERIPEFAPFGTPILVPSTCQLRMTATYRNDSDQTVYAGTRWDGEEAFRMIAFYYAAPLPAPAEFLWFH
jgi:hypothetical protein